jgi:hypothetical protein
METSFEHVEFTGDSPEKMPAKGSLKDFIDGSVLTRDLVIRQLPYIIFLAVLAIIYIGNRYHAEKLVRRSGELQTELKELRAEAITVSAELMDMSRQSEVLKLLRKNNLNLVESLEPPRKILVKKGRR